MAVTVKIDGKSARWVQLLEDFGHLSPDDADRLLVGVAEIMHAPSRPAGGVARKEWGTPRHPATVDPQDLRRAAAMLLFSQSAEPGRALTEDWPLLFS